MTRRDSHGRFKADRRARKGAIAAATAVTAVAAGVAAAFRFGWLDRFLPGSRAEHAAPDLALAAPRPGEGDRAPDAFRPDPTAPVPKAEREALRPAEGVGTGFMDDGEAVEINC